MSIILVGKPDAYRLKAIQDPSGKSRGRCDCRYPSPDNTSHNTLRPVSNGGVFYCSPSTSVEPWRPEKSLTWGRRIKAVAEMVNTSGETPQRIGKVTDTKLKVRQDTMVNPFTIAAAIAGWTIWVAVCGGGLFLVYTEFQQCRTNYRHLPV